MKKIKLLLVSAVAAVLVGCGHGYEGEYAVEVQDALFGQKTTSEAVMVLGGDYMEMEGERTEFDSIEVKGDRLVLTQEGKSPESLKIIDGDTLVMDAGLAVMKFTKI